VRLVLSRALLGRLLLELGHMLLNWRTIHLLGTSIVIFTRPEDRVAH
jgi:hypothetical protein